MLLIKLLSLSLIASATPLLESYEPRGREPNCGDAKCYKRLEYGDSHGHDASKDCKSFLKATATPCPKTKTATVTKVCATTTVTSTAGHPVETGKKKAAVELKAAQTTTCKPKISHPTHVPNYASKDCKSADWASACSCLGVSKTTTTLAPKTETETKTKCSTKTETVVVTATTSSASTTQTSSTTKSTTSYTAKSTTASTTKSITTSTTSTKESTTTSTTSSTTKSTTNSTTASTTTSSSTTSSATATTTTTKSTTTSTSAQPTLVACDPAKSNTFGEGGCTDCFCDMSGDGTHAYCAYQGGSMQDCSSGQRCPAGEFCDASAGYACLNSEGPTAGQQCASTYKTPSKRNLDAVLGMNAMNPSRRR